MELWVYLFTQNQMYWCTSLIIHYWACSPPPKGWFAVSKITVTCWNPYSLSYEYNYHQILPRPQNEAPLYFWTRVCTPVQEVNVWTHQLLVCVTLSIHNSGVVLVPVLYYFHFWGSYALCETHNYPMTSHMYLGWFPITIKILYNFYLSQTNSIDTIYLVNDLASNS